MCTRKWWWTSRTLNSIFHCSFLLVGGESHISVIWPFLKANKASFWVQASSRNNGYLRKNSLQMRVCMRVVCVVTNCGNCKSFMWWPKDDIFGKCVWFLPQATTLPPNPTLWPFLGLRNPSQLRAFNQTLISEDIFVFTLNQFKCWHDYKVIFYQHFTSIDFYMKR